ncbi:MAG: pyridoxal phosphate-dependent aminotransferase [Actinobacteria bacterium]|nr:pyridoxal phosphate-dependent aminotransferase [Actinomycetota bacterium]MCB9388373.1 pyridoxal phosphate-dependent aminotransferase [Acidimicrobiia bacterium]
MDDLTAGLADPGVIMLGGGAPAVIPEVVDWAQDAWQRLGRNTVRLNDALCKYSPGRGDAEFREVLSGAFNERFGWDITADHIALTTGTQAAFSMLFELFAGPMPDGTNRSVVVPMAPEYVGYADLGLSSDIISSAVPTVDQLDSRRFVYKVDPSSIDLSNAGLMCASRPCNPTGNVLSEAECDLLTDLCAEHEVPFVLDCAYGLPFPGVIFTEALPRWRPGTITCLSLSKVGLPGIRTGIVIADPDLTEAIATMTSVVNLSPNSIGPALVTEAIRSGELFELTHTIQRFYAARRDTAVDIAFNVFERSGIDWQMHDPLGAFFLWFRFPGIGHMPDNRTGTAHGDRALYQRLANRGVVVVAGHHFMAGLPARDDGRVWEHATECIRVSYCAPEDQIAAGMAAIAEEVRSLQADR